MLEKIKELHEVNSGELQNLLDVSQEKVKEERKKLEEISIQVMPLIESLRGEIDLEKEKVLKQSELIERIHTDNKTLIEQKKVFVEERNNLYSLKEKQAE